MGRIIQPKGNKGSLKWIQHIVNDLPHILNKPINEFIGSKKESRIEWLSPKADDDYAEYRDQDFLDLLGIKLTKTKLGDFWPSRGPQWDALGRIDDKAYFLVEAKAHVAEIISSSQAKAPSSKSLIKKSLKETAKALKLNPSFDLTSRPFCFSWFLFKHIKSPLLIVYYRFLNLEPPPVLLLNLLLVSLGAHLLEA